MCRAVLATSDLLLPCFANAHVNVTDIKIKPALMAGYPTTVYFSLENDSDQLDYLLEVKSINFPSSKITIHKTIIEKNPPINVLCSSPYQLKLRLTF